MLEEKCINVEVYRDSLGVVAFHIKSAYADKYKGWTYCHNSRMYEEMKNIASYYNNHPSGECIGITFTIG